MGYDYTIQGWYKAPVPVDLSQLPLRSGSAGVYEFTEHDRLHWWLQVLGRNRNYVTFATKAKHRSNYYLEAVLAVMEGSGANGLGLITITGEITHDGKDRIVIARDRSLLTVPTARLYDPFSSWNAVYRWSHYMGRSVEDLVMPDDGYLRKTLAGRTSIQGWLGLHDVHGPDPDANAERIISDVVKRHPPLRDGIAVLRQNWAPYLLIGQDDMDAASAIAVLAELTTARQDAYGMLYCSAADEPTQIPVAIQNGRVIVLPELSLAADAETKLLPTPIDAYEGLASGTDFVGVRSSLNLHGLFQKIAGAAGAEPLAPHGGWREETNRSLASYVFEAHGLACFLMSDPGPQYGGSPYVLGLYSRGEADPNMRKRQVAALITCLRADGIDVDRAAES